MSQKSVMNCCLRGRLAMVCLLIGLMVVISGCSAAQRTTPHMGFGPFSMEAEIERDDVVILDRVEGESSLTTVFFGLIQVIDGDKLAVLGIKFFKDKYVWKEPGQMGPATAASRAYYKALESQPSADAVFYKSWEREESGIPLLFHNENVTFRGKALQLKQDQAG